MYARAGIYAAILLLGLRSFAAVPSFRQDVRFTDPASCAECHLDACSDWEKSDHRHSMDHANDETVLGGFSNVRFVHIGFDDLLFFSDETLQILIDDVFYSPQPSWAMREYGQTEPGRKFKPPLEPRFEDFVLACFDEEPVIALRSIPAFVGDGSIAEKLRRVMNEMQRKEFDDEREYRKMLLVNRPSEISGAQSRIVGRLQELLERKKVQDDVLPKRCATFRMYRDGKKFMVETDAGTHEVRFTLGFRPLQQYLVEKEGGRLQCLPVAWDSVDRRWFHLYPKEQIPKEDPLHWTKPLQNWNFMCADCHTTGFEKNFDSKNLAYHSTFTEINVGCQSCHGPCGEHVETARTHNLLTKWQNGIPMGTDLLSGMENQQSIASCAACHTRRRVLRNGIGIRASLEPLLDSIVPEMLDHSIYYPDGQLLEEAFEVGSFMQSKMYSKGVSCTNCHEPHSLHLRFTGNRLCTQCHAPAIYDTVGHHFHSDLSKPGTQCVECHFPQSTYMIADPRRDHSIRKPSPELTMLTGVPNACMLCHQDRKRGETLEWAHEHVERWYSELRASSVGYTASDSISKHYSLAIAAGRRGDPKALPLLIEIVRNKTQRDHRDMVRASALLLFGQAAPSEHSGLMIESLQDHDPLVRWAAVESFFRQPAEVRLQYLPNPLHDPLLAIRIESARMLAEVSDRLQDETKKAFEAAAQEFAAAQLAMNDQAASYLNLAVFEHDRETSRRRQVETWFSATMQDIQRKGGPNVQASLAETTKVHNEYLRRLTTKPLELYRQSLRVDPEFIPSRINLAMLHNERGEPKEAEEQFREVLRIDPQQGEAAYSLGLLLAEWNRLDEAGEQLKRAAELRPKNTRIRYNYGLLLMQQEKHQEAQEELEAALNIEPDNATFLRALAILRLQMENRSGAIKTVD